MLDRTWLLMRAHFWVQSWLLVRTLFWIEGVASKIGCFWCNAGAVVYAKMLKVRQYRRGPLLKWEIQRGYDNLWGKYHPHPSYCEQICIVILQYFWCGYVRIEENDTSSMFRIQRDRVLLSLSPSRLSSIYAFSSKVHSKLMLIEIVITNYETNNYHNFGSLQCQY